MHRLLQPVLSNYWRPPRVRRKKTWRKRPNRAGRRRRTTPRRRHPRLLPASFRRPLTPRQQIPRRTHRPEAARLPDRPLTPMPQKRQTRSISQAHLLPRRRLPQCNHRQIPQPSKMAISKADSRLERRPPPMSIRLKRRTHPQRRPIKRTTKPWPPKSRLPHRVTHRRRIRPDRRRQRTVPTKAPARAIKARRQKCRRPMTKRRLA